MQAVLHIDIKDNTLPNLGTPLKPNRKMKIPKESKEAFNYGYTGPLEYANNALENTSLNTTTVSLDLQSGSNDFKGDFMYTDDVLRTYKFFDMDISDDFKAVIPIGNGHIIVGNMFNPVLLNKIINSKEDRFTPTTKAVISSLDEMDVRKIVTALKTGTLYSIAKNLSDSLADVEDYGTFLKDYASKVGEDLLGTVNASDILTYKSIILNLINRKEEVVSSVNQGYSGADVDVIGQQVLSVLMESWSVLMDDYAKTRLALSSLDLWSYYGKLSMGEKAFNQSLEKSGAISFTNPVTGEVSDVGISFSGVTTNLVMVGKYAEVKNLANAVKDFGDSLSKSDIGAMKKLPMLDLVQSMISEEDFDFGVDGLATLSLEESQAFAVLDTLRYTDEDAEFAKETYDLSDPEQRGLYVRSAIKSYERNFKEFKPARSYDVTSEIANLVENVGVESVKLITIDKDDPNVENVDDLITMTSKEVEVRVDIKSIKKAFALIRRSLDKVSKSF